MELLFEHFALLIHKQTEAGFDEKAKVYRIVTKTAFKKGEQVLLRAQLLYGTCCLFYPDFTARCSFATETIPTWRCCLSMASVCRRTRTTFFRSIIQSLPNVCLNWNRIRHSELEKKR